MFSMCSELTPRARIPDTRIPQLMQPFDGEYIVLKLDYFQPCTGQHAFHPLLLIQSILFNNRDVDDVDDFSHLLF